MRQWFEKFPCTGKCDRHLQRVTDEQGWRRAGGKQPDDDKPGDLAERIHDSHQLGYKQGFYWCWRCAKVATSKVQKLGERCAGPVADRSAKTMLRRLRQGRLPYAAWTMWPTEKRQKQVLTLSAPKPKVIAKTKRSQQQKRRRYRAKKPDREGGEVAVPEDTAAKARQQHLSSCSDVQIFQSCDSVPDAESDTDPLQLGFDIG